MLLSFIKKQQIKVVARLYENNVYVYSVQRNMSPFQRRKRTTDSEFVRYFAPNDKIIWDTKQFSGNNNNSEPVVDSDSQTSNFAFKSLLYDENSDRVIAEINSCKDMTQLLKLIKNSNEHFNHTHFIQSLLVLKDLLRDSQIGLVNELLDQILNGLHPDIKTMNITEQSCCYLYLRKFAVPNTNTVVRQLLMEALHKVSTTSSDTPIELPALSRLTVGINTGYDFHIPSVCSQFVPHIMTHIKHCDSGEDLRLLSICLINLETLTTIDNLEFFKKKLDILIKRRTVGAQHPRTVLKLLQLLNLPTWSKLNGRLIRDLLLLLQPNLANLNISDLKTTCRIFGYHFEPADLIEPLRTLMEDIVTKQSSKTDILAAYMPFLEPNRRESIIDVFKNIISSSECWQGHYADSDCFQIIRTLKISDANICNVYWAKVLSSLDNSGGEESNLLFLRHCHRYMYFNNNMGGTYRFTPLERRLSKLAIQAIENDIAGRLPSKFARLAAFVLAYGHTPFGWKKFPNLLLSKIISMAHQFSVIDCFFLSRGIHIALELRFRNDISSVLGMQLATLESVMTDCIARQLENKCLSIYDLNIIVRTLGYGKSMKNKSIYQEALHRYKELDYSELNSRTIREMAFNFNASNCLVPKALDAMFSYIENHHEHIIGDTAEKILSCAYNLGYTPISDIALFNAALVIKRDFKHMSGMSIVQACLALCYYKAIPEDLIDMVFCVKFIQRIEEEIQMCYSKATYPERVLNLIMQLNRTVCLDYPEANVPWFQQNFLEAQLSRKSKTQNRFSADVRKLLGAVLSDASFFRCNHITPYGYQIDFVIHFDKNRKPIPAPAETTILHRITKVAILLLRLDSFCENDLTALRGPEHLRTKHLEMMGYKVVHINEHDWNTRYMNSPQIKTNYLKCLLQI